MTSERLRMSALVNERPSGLQIRTALDSCQAAFTSSSSMCSLDPMRGKLEKFSLDALVNVAAAAGSLRLAALARDVRRPLPA